jgi:perosamine synthetase
VSDPGVALTLEKMCVDNHATVSAALELMTTNLMGIAFIVDSDNRLMGCVTDGDIRRLTLEEKLDLSGPISVVMNKSPSALLMSSDSDETYAALSSGLADGKTVFPRLDAAGRIQSFSYRQSWGLVPIAEPSLTGNESAYVLECLASNWISSTGPFVGRFESAFAA